MTGAALLVIVLLTVASACSGPAAKVITSTGDTAEPLSARVEADEFDARPYRELPPPPRVAIEHDAPESLLRGQAARSQERTQQGYRIQILSTRSREEADLRSGQVIQWWIEEREKGNLAAVLPRADGAPPVYQDFSEPYWRIRLGDFGTRTGAQTALAAVREHFGSAFIAPAEIPLR